MEQGLKSHPARKFKNFFLDTKFQIRFGAKLALAGAFLGAINTTVFHYYMRENYDVFIDPLLATGLLDENLANFLYKELNHITMIMGVITLGFCLSCILLGFFFSHNIIGPTFAFKRTFKKIEEGDLSARVKLRPKDEFQDFAQVFNKLMDHIQTKYK